MKILGKSKNMNMNKTEISLNISLIIYYVVFSRVFTYSTGDMFCRLLHCHHVKLDIVNEACSDRKYHATPV